MAEPKLYAPFTVKSREGRFGTEFKISAKADALIDFIHAHVNARGYINCEMGPRKETGKYGETHNVTLDTWEPSQRSDQVSPTANTRPRAVPAPQPMLADDLDGKYGDEVVNFSPRDWTGASIKGLPMSQCPADALDLLADAFASFGNRNAAADARTDSGKPKADYDRRSEARARGWAARIRSGRHVQAPMVTEEEIPFAWALPFLLPLAIHSVLYVQMVA